MYKTYTGKDPAELMPKSLPEPATFESNIDYVRNVLEEQLMLTAKDQEYVEVSALPEDYRYFDWRYPDGEGSPAGPHM